MEDVKLSSVKGNTDEDFQHFDDHRPEPVLQREDGKRHRSRSVLRSGPGGGVERRASMGKDSGRRLGEEGRRVLHGTQVDSGSPETGIRGKGAATVLDAGSDH